MLIFINIFVKKTLLCNKKLTSQNGHTILIKALSLQKIKTVGKKHSDMSFELGVGARNTLCSNH